MPATAKFLQAIAKLKQGAVVLPGLDTDLDDEAWQSIGGEDGAPLPSHPQFALHALLARFGIARKDVGELGASAPHGREGPCIGGDASGQRQRAMAHAPL